ncbi:MAG: SAM-dependent methyltransferase [Bacteroidales bacterium]|nr:SAM-dependent methyltransferase [Bacteroidales bacterium]
MNKLTSFVSQHMSDDTTRLILDRNKWPDIDVDMAVNCIESRRKLRGKVQEWYDEPELIFPLKLSAEQCSSSGTARYKARLAQRIADEGLQVAGEGMKIADLTGGFGVDSWFFSKIADKVLYNEMQTVLADAARHNFSVLEADNIIISNKMVSKDEGSTVAEVLGEFAPDIVYMDPARRGEGGRKVFLIEDCQPDVLGLKEDIFKVSPHFLIKLSPMADITMAAERLGRQCREIHIVAAGGECKELLVWMDRDWDGDYTVITCEIGNDSTEYQGLTFKSSEERESTAHPAEKPLEAAGKWLFEPGKALMKAGAFNLISARFGIGKDAAPTTKENHIFFK